MDSKEKTNINPEKIHQHQAIIWIYLPLVLICLLVLVAGIFIVVKSGTNESLTQTWSSVGQILMIMPVVILGIVNFTILILAIFGMAKANQALPPHMRSIRETIIRVNQNAQNITNKTATPVIKTRSFFAAVKTLFTAILRNHS